MQVLSPVGEFKVAVDGVRIRDGRLVVHMSMGAWRSEATLERGDLPYVGVARACWHVQSVKIALKAELGSHDCG
jgi:hypothetical protein